MEPMSRLAGLYSAIACAWEATARKPGNVHRYRDFDDATFVDFTTSAACLQTAFDEAAYRDLIDFMFGDKPFIGRRVGQLVYQAISMTSQLVRTNTNLGIALVLAPLAKISAGREVSQPD